MSHSYACISDAQPLFDVERAYPRGVTSGIQPELRFFPLKIRVGGRVTPKVEIHSIAIIHSRRPTYFFPRRLYLLSRSTIDRRVDPRLKPVSSTLKITEAGYRSFRIASLRLSKQDLTVEQLRPSNREASIGRVKHVSSVGQRALKRSIYLREIDVSKVSDLVGKRLARISSARLLTRESDVGTPSLETLLIQDTSSSSSIVDSNY